MREQNATMNHISSTSISKMTFLCYLFIIASIASSDILWVKMSANREYETIAQYAYICLLGIIIFAYYRMNRLQIKFSLEAGLFIFTVLMLLFVAVTTEDSINAYLFKTALIIGGYYGARLFCFESFYQAFRRIMSILMLASLLLYFMKLTGVGYAALPVNRISTGVQYSTIGLANIYNNAFYQIPRAQSVFWESGVYATYLNILLLFELFYREEIDAKYLILLAVSIATTISTTGYIVFIIIMIAYTLSKQTSQLRTKVLTTVLLIVLFLIIAFNETILSQLTSKINDNSESFKNRWLSIAGNYFVIKEAPVFGLGPTKSQIMIESYIRSQGGVRSLNNLNTILANYAVFGLLPFIYYIFHLLKFCFSLRINMVGKILIVLAIVFLLSSTGYQYSPFFTLVFMYRIGQKADPRTVSFRVFVPSKME